LAAIKRAVREGKNFPAPGSFKRLGNRGAIGNRDQTAPGDLAGDPAE